MAQTPITDVYHYLQLQMPEYLDAVNFCLVAGNLRTGTLISPYKDPSCAYRPVSEKILGYAISNFPQITMQRFGDSNLVYHRSQQIRVNQLPTNLHHQNLTPIQSQTLGKILNYFCPGDTGGYHKIEYQVPNPWSHKPNGFFGQACKNIDQPLKNQMISYGHQVQQFFEDHDLDFDLTLKISHFEHQNNAAHEVIDDEYTF